MFNCVKKFFILLMCSPVLLQAESHSVPFTMVNGLILIEASIGTETGLFILDTGADDIIINGSLIGQGKSQTFNTLGGDFESELSDIDGVSIGELWLDHKQSFVANLGKLENWLGVELKGILGAQVFTPNVISVDYTSQKLLVASDITEIVIEHQNKNMITNLNGILLIDVEIDHKLHHFILDSGASSHHIDVEACMDNSTQYIFLSEQVDIITANREIKTKNVISLDEATIGSTPIVNNRFIISNLSTLSHALGLHVSGLLSLSKLGLQGFTIDLKNGVLYL